MRKKANQYRFSWLNKWFVMQLVVLSFMWYLSYVCFDVIKDIEPLKTFIPHELLGVASDATPS